jgi:hypothetical protein
MTINRRRAASSEVSSQKKLAGHKNEEELSGLIGGQVLKGTQKGDIRTADGSLLSVKSGKKWQIFLYGYDRIKNAEYLNILKPCLDAFTEDPQLYFQDRVKCIEYKEAYVKKHGRLSASLLENEIVAKALGKNEYINAKTKLSLQTLEVCEKLKNKFFLRNFLAEAIFDGDNVSYLAVKDSTLKMDNAFNIFFREDVLDILSESLFPHVSKSGNVPEDFNVPAQKTLLCYSTTKTPKKNIVEIEIRNDSVQHYRRVRFNMYSKDALTLLMNSLDVHSEKSSDEKVLYFGQAADRISKVGKKT